MVDLRRQVARDPDRDDCTHGRVHAIGWGQPDYWSAGATSRMFKATAIFSLSLTAYNALFGLVGLLTQRSIIVGIAYIFVLEVIVANIDFVIRKVTVMYYFRVLCERWMALTTVWPTPGNSRLDFGITMEDAPTFRGASSTLMIAGVALIAASCLVMHTREFRVKTPEGS